MKLPQYANADRPHLSYSRVISYLACGWRYYLRYVERAVSPVRAALALGRAAHATAAADFRHKIESGTDFGRDQIREEFRSQLAQEWGEVELSKSEISDFVNKGRAQDRIRHRGDLIFDTFLDVTAPKVRPVEVERLVRIPTSGGFDLVVIPDVLEPDAAGDLKFGRSALDADDSMQLTVEAIAFAHVNAGRFPDRVYFERYKPSDKPSPPERLESKRGPEDVKTVATLFEKVAEGIDRDIFMPTGRASDWQCKACEYGPNGIDSCVYAKRGER